MSWNYRVMRHTHTNPLGEQESSFFIHEVYYKNKKVNDHTVSTKDVGYSSDPRPAFGESLEALRACLNLMLAALDKPVLDYIQCDVPSAEE